MKQFERFAECLKRILQEQKVSVTEVAKAVGFKSRNSLFRILNDQTSYDVEHTFLKNLRQSGIVELSENEWNKLEESLEISRVGISNYVSNQAIRNQLLLPKPKNDDFVCASLGDEPEEISLHELMQRYIDSREVELHIFCCCHPAFCRTVAQVLSETKPDCNLAVYQYIFAGEKEIVANMMSIQPLLYMDCYKAYMLEPDTCPPETETVLRNNSTIVHYVDHQGEHHWEYLILVNSQRIVRSVMGDDRLYNMVRSLMAEDAPVKHLVKSEFNNLCHSVEDYMNYTENLRLLERNCAIMSLKPDIPINFVHPDVLVAPIMEGLHEMGAGDDDDVAQLIRQLYDIHLQRYENFINKKKVTHTVFSRSAMESFAKTGKQSDHFYAQRPYTVSERHQILTALREQACNNPYFWVYFINDEVAAHQAEITLYEGRGTMFVQADTGYHLGGDHNEALINNADLNMKLKNFFLKDLLPNYVLSYQENIAILDELIRMLE